MNKACYSAKFQTSIFVNIKLILPSVLFYFIVVLGFVVWDEAE